MSFVSDMIFNSGRFIVGNLNFISCFTFIQSLFCILMISLQSLFGLTDHVSLILYFDLFISVIA